MKFYHSAHLVCSFIAHCVSPVSGLIVHDLHSSCQWSKTIKVQLSPNSRLRIHFLHITAKTHNSQWHTFSCFRSSTCCGDHHGIHWTVVCTSPGLAMFLRSRLSQLLKLSAKDTEISLSRSLKRITLIIPYDQSSLELILSRGRDFYGDARNKPEGKGIVSSVPFLPLSRHTKTNLRSDRYCYIFEKAS